MCGKCKFLPQKEVFNGDVTNPYPQDILSFNAEQARGDTHNAVIVVMNERGMSIQEAMDFLGAWYRSNVAEFCTAMRDLPQCRTIAMRNWVKTYVAGIANWVTGNYDWSLRSRRYFTGGLDPVKDGWDVALWNKTGQDRDR